MKYKYYHFCSHTIKNILFVAVYDTTCISLFYFFLICTNSRSFIESKIEKNLFVFQISFLENKYYKTVKILGIDDFVIFHERFYKYVTFQRILQAYIIIAVSKHIEEVSVFSVK